MPSMPSPPRPVNALQPCPAAQTLTPVSAAQAAPVHKQAVPAVISERPTPQTTVPDVVSGVLTAVGVSPVSGNEPGAPVESPASVALFAGCRRLSEQGPDR